MQTTSFTQIIIKADENHWLYNEKENTFAKTVYLGKDASANDWKEINSDEYENLSTKTQEDTTI